MNSPRETVAIDEVLRAFFAEDAESSADTQKQFTGRWTRVVAEVRNLYRDDPTAPVSVFAIRREDPRAALLGAGFLLRFSDDEERARAAHLPRRMLIDAYGRIDDCADGVVVLSECRFSDSSTEGVTSSPIE